MCRFLASVLLLPDDAGGTQIMVLKKQLQDFKEERETLKSTVQRLTGELSRYQSKYRIPSAVSTVVPLVSKMFRLQVC